MNVPTAPRRPSGLTMAQLVENARRANQTLPTLAEATDRLRRSMLAVGKSWAGIMQRINEQMAALHASLKATRPSLRALAIAAHGPGNEDADGVWLTDLCAAWVHDSCPSSFCGCTCHGGA